MKFYTLSPIGVPENQVLFPTMRPVFIAEGHSFVDSIEEADVVLLDLHSRIADYKQSDLDYIIENRVRFVTFDEWDRGNMSTDRWPHPLTNQQQDFAYKFESTGQPRVHFCRLLTKGQAIPPNLYPFEKPIFYEEPLSTSDELFNREFDIVFCANYSPSRQAIAETFQADTRLRTFISIGAKKRPFDEFVHLHKRGKLFINSGAGGYTCERPQCLFSIAGMIRENTNQLLEHEFIHAYDCLKIDSPPTKEQLDIIYSFVNDKELLYDIYLRGYNTMKEYYSSEYISKYILEKIIKHLQ